jgi:Uma2 family endonuclease
MTMLVLDDSLKKSIRAEREASGADRWDEVWDGVYVASPLPNNEHQRIVARLIYILESAIGVPGLGAVLPGVNVSDRDKGWKRNYRGPDVTVFLADTKAINRDTHWVGGPDFAVEVMSKGDRAREKIPFYAKVGVRELLLVNRRPWALELFASKTPRSCSRVSPHSERLTRYIRR